LWQMEWDQFVCLRVLSDAGFAISLEAETTPHRPVLDPTGGLFFKVRPLAEGTQLLSDVSV